MPIRGTLVHGFAGLAALAGLILLPAISVRAEESGPTVFAAASLRTALDAVNAAWKTETGKSATLSYAASSALAKQIEGGAPADIFVSADLAWMDYLAEKTLIKDETRAELLGNTIVLIAPKDSGAETTIAKGFPLADLLGEGRLAMANTESVPAGKYGKAALEFLGAWDGVKDKVAEAENVRAALLLVSRGEAPLGIVYTTDATSDASVRIVGTFPAESHPPIVYPLALTAGSTSTDAAAFLDYIKGAKAKTLFEAEGFTVLTPSAK